MYYKYRLVVESNVLVLYENGKVGEIAFGAVWIFCDRHLFMSRSIPISKKSILLNWSCMLDMLNKMIAKSLA